MKHSPAQDQETYRRATNAAVSGLIAQGVLALGMTLLALHTHSPAVQAAAWHLYGGLGIWGILVLIYHQHRVERVEALETQQLTQTDARAAALFDEHGQDLRVAQRRLERLNRWGITIAGLVVAVYLIAVAVVLGRLAYQDYQAGVIDQGVIREGAGGSVVMVAASVAAFLAFIVARYVAGMTGVPQWGLLRAGAGYLMGNCLVAVMIVVGGLCLQFDNPVVMGYLGLIIPGILLILGVEIVAAQLTQIYRPRRVGQINRPAFDSRLLSWLTNPESIAGAINEAVNYQFGFEVSRSWFYVLLSRAVTPLIIFAVVTLLAMSCLVVVAPHEQAVVVRFGRIVRNAQQTRDQILKAGLHFKMPWPISRVEKYPVGRIQQITIGSATGPFRADQAMLWTNKHAENEQYLITAPTPWQAGSGAGGGAESMTVGQNADRGASGLSLVGAQVIVQYRVTDLSSYLRSSQDPRSLLATIAMRRVNASFAKKDIDVLLGPGRTATGQQLLHQIQHDVETYGLGIETVFVSLAGIHPPAEQGVAAAFLEQIDTLQERQSLIEQARQEAIEILASVAGTPDKAMEIDRAILALQSLRVQNDSPTGPPTSQELEHREGEVARLVALSRGQAGQEIDEASADRWQRVVSESAKAQRFAAEVIAYRNAPVYYRQKQYLDALADGLAHARKYIMAVDQGVPPVFRLDLKDVGSTVDTLFNPDE